MSLEVMEMMEARVQSLVDKLVEVLEYRGMWSAPRVVALGAILVTAYTGDHTQGLALLEGLGEEDMQEVVDILREAEGVMA